MGGGHRLRYWHREQRRRHQQRRLPALPRPTDPLAGLTGTQILARALNDLKTASSVHFSGSFADSGQLTEMDMTIVHPASCQGTMGLGSKGSIAFIQLGKDAWVKPDKLFWTTQGSTQPSRAEYVFGAISQDQPR